MKRPMKPHVAGFEDEEDCEGYYAPDEAERRDCHRIIGRSQSDPCQKCIDAYRVKDQAIRQAAWDAKTPEEKAEHEAFIKGLRKLY